MARQPSEQFTLAPGAITSELDEYTRPTYWRLCWYDGPTEAQVQRAAKELDAEALDGVKFYRDYSPLAWAVQAIRMSMTLPRTATSGRGSAHSTPASSSPP
ncbi:hypothetical protein [Streptomyces crystallinus]